MDPREEIVSIAGKIEMSGLTRGTWGNVSLRYGEKIYITPSGVPYDELEPDDIAILDMDGNQIGGQKKRSTEFPLHLMIYKEFENINGIVHTHSVHASAFASAGMEIPCLTEDQAQIIGGRVPVCEYAHPGTEELARNVVNVLKEKNVFAVLMRKHGVVAIGRNLKEAFIAAQIVEKSAQIAIEAKILGNVEEISQEEIEFFRDEYLKSYSLNILRER